MVISCCLARSSLALFFADLDAALSYSAQVRNGNRLPPEEQASSSRAPLQASGRDQPLQRRSRLLRRAGRSRSPRFRSSLVLAPDLIDPSLVRFQVLERRGQKAEALELFEQAFAISPDSPMVAFRRAKALVSVGQIQVSFHTPLLSPFPPLSSWLPTPSVPS